MQRQALLALARLENPLVTINDASDCVSCHVGAQLSRFAERQGLSVSETAEAYVVPAGYDGRHLPGPGTSGNTGNTIMFGYHTDHTGATKASISRRVIFETIEVLRYLSAK